MQRWGSARAVFRRVAKFCWEHGGERYTWQIAMTIAVLLLQAGLIAALLNAHRQRRLALVQSAQRTKELAHVNRLSMAGELTASIAHEINQPWLLSDKRPNRGCDPEISYA